MALSRRTGARFQASIWPGFVDAMTGLLLVLMFVLTIFMVVQFTLRETISGQADKLDALSLEVSALADALGLERDQNRDLRGALGTLRTTLSDTEAQSQAQQALIAQLQGSLASQTAALSEAETRITSFEAQVAALLADRDAGLAQIANLETRQAELLSEQEALSLALASARDEINAGVEAARLAAARREALEALAEDLRRQNAEETAALQSQLSEAQEALTAEETARLAEAAAAEALRDKLANADTELTAMTLALEEQRRDAEETLTLLAAAQAAEAELTQRLTDAVLAQQEASAALSSQGATEAELRQLLADALAAERDARDTASQRLTESETRAALLEAAKAELSQQEAQTLDAQRQSALLNQQVAALRQQLGDLQALLDDARARDAAAQVQLETLGSDLNAALARAAAEQRARAELEAERARDLENYRSEFFGRMREVLGQQDGIRIEGDRFVFASEVLFPPGGATLSATGQAEIAKVASILRAVGADIPREIDWVIRVDGHTDNVPLSGTGQFADNWELSQARALSVVKYMIDFLGLPPNRLAANGFGQYQPIDPADTPQARAQNRRIELKLTER